MEENEFDIKLNSTEAILFIIMLISKKNTIIKQKQNKKKANIIKKWLEN